MLPVRPADILSGLLGSPEVKLRWPRRLEVRVPPQRTQRSAKDEHVI